MGIKLVALDMDGTTLNSQVKLAKETRECILEAIAQGVYVVPCTGRVFNQLPPEFLTMEELTYAVTANGARVTNVAKDNTMMYSNPLAPNDVHTLFDTFKDYEVMLEIYIEGKPYMERRCFENLVSFGVPKQYEHFFTSTNTVLDNRQDLEDFALEHAVEKINLFLADVDEKQALRNQIESTLSLMITTSMDTNMEINNTTANKGDGLAHLCQMLDIPSTEVMAIGDSNNDVEMLKFAGLAVAMENAVEEVKGISNFITASNDDLGVVKAMDQFVFSA